MTFVAALLGFAGAASASAAVLLGNQAVGANLDGNGAGIAEAFSTTATTTGSVSSLSVYVDSTSKATTLVAGLYADNSGHPGTLLTQGSLTAPTAGSFNQITVPSATVTAGSTYWLSVLGPAGAGTLEFRDARSGTHSENSSQTTLTSLPATWSSGASWNNSPISAYASGSTATGPVLSMSPTSLSFSATAGGSDPVPAPLSVSNSGSSSLSYTAATDQPWLHVSPSSGTAPQTLTVSASIGGMSAGTFTGHVTVTAAGAQGSPALIPVTLTLTTPPPPNSGDWLTGEHDAGRSGFASDETMITNTNAGNLSPAWSTTLDGKITSQPLYASAVEVEGATHNVVIAATDGNSVYALDAGTGAVLWRHNFGSQSNNISIPGGFGVVGIPVIDRQAGRIYAVSNDGNLHVLSLADGSDAVPPTPVVNAPITNKVWGALQLFRGNLYIATGSDCCDTPPWNGGIYQVDVTGSSPVVVKHWLTVPDPPGGGGIWGYGGVSIDTGNGHIYTTSAEDTNGGGTDYSDRILALDSNLNVLGAYEATNPTTFGCSSQPCDLDFASTPVMFTPNGCPTMLAAGSKNGNLYLMRESDLESSGTPIQTLQLNDPNDSLGSGGVGGTFAYWPAGRMLFVGDTGPGVNGVAGGLVGLTIQADCTLKVAWSQQLGGSDSPNSTPTVADGVVFIGLGTGKLQAFDAATGTPLWDSGSIGTAVYAAPIVAAGRVYVGTWNGFTASDTGTLRAYALGSGPPPPPPPTSLVGDSNIASGLDENSAGRAEAFQATAGASGTSTKLEAYVDATSGATQLVAGIYSDNGGHPGTLLAQGTLSSPTAGAWNTVPLPSTSITQGTTYWIALLGPSGAGTLHFRDTSRGTRSENSSQTNLTSLPSTWTTGPAWTDSPVSAYAAG